MSGTTRCTFPKVVRDNIPDGHELCPTSREDARSLARMIWGRLVAEHERREKAAACAAAAPPADAD